ncbi:UNVERIFIED_CONTAM: 30S ribosomal protein S10, chloroplastic [Sesamum radiatum]
MASISSSSLSTMAFAVCNSSGISTRPQLSFPASIPSRLLAVKPSRMSSSRILAAPEVLESSANSDATEGEAPSSSTLSVAADSDKLVQFLPSLVSTNNRTGMMGLDEVYYGSINYVSKVAKVAPKQKIRIKLRSYWVPLIEDSCKQIMDAARTTNAKTMGPVPLPTKKRVYCVLKSPHVHKDARFHFEIRTHQRLIDILYPTAQTIDSLMQLDLPAGVDVEVKL